MPCLVGFLDWRPNDFSSYNKVMSSAVNNPIVTTAEKSRPDDPRSDSSSDDSDGQGASITTAELVTSAELTNIRELATDEPSSISGALRYCKRRILYPYLRLLGIMGFKPTLWSVESVDSGICLTLLNRAYFLLVLLLLLAGYVLQYLSCFRRDRGFRHKDEATSEIHPLLVHLLPSLFHFSAFLYMVYLYRVGEDEQLENLMERVFIQAAQSHSQFFSQRKLLRTLQWLVVSSFIWLVFSTACQLGQIWSAKDIEFSWISLSGNNALRIALIATLALSTVWQDAIQVTVIASYCIHCVLLSNYLQLLYARVQQHTLSLGECTKEIAEFEKLAHYLNSDLSPSLGPLLILNSAMSISAMVFLATNKMRAVNFVCLLAAALLWFILFIYPLVQAAILSSKCKKVRQIGHFVRLRPFGYQDVPQDELDSFLLFVSTLQMVVRVFKISVTAPKLAALFVFGTFVVLLWGLMSKEAEKSGEWQWMNLSV